MRIIFVRHGETAFNVGEKRVRGRYEIPLSEEGKKHAEEAGKTLSSFPVDIIYYSRISRAKETAESIKKYQKEAKLIEEPFLIDLSFGDWEGKKYSEVFTPEEEEQWFINPFKFIPENGETFYQALDRLHRLFVRLEKQGEKNVVLVSHGAIFNLLFTYLYQTHPSQFWKFYVAPCSISEIEFHSLDKFDLVKINDTTHLTYEKGE